MVKALLEGRKQQTRRILKDQPGDLDKPFMMDDGSWHVTDSRGGHMSPLAVRFTKGDRLWVRENLWLYGRWRQEGTTPKGRPRQTFDLIGKVAAFEKPADIAYWGGKAGFAFRPGIHMPRWASRLTLTVTDVRVQRLQECSEEDAIAEGATERPNCSGAGDLASGWCMDWSRVGEPSKWADDGKTLQERDVSLATARYAFWNLIDRINGAGAWAANPWIVALTFTVERRNIDAC